MTGTRPTALVTAPFRGEGMATLESLADVVYDPWIEQVPLRLYDGEKLAARIAEAGADILIVESDFVNGPVFDCDLRVIGSCRGDPNNVDIPAATKAGIPVLNAPGRNADAVAEITIALLFAVNRHLVEGDMRHRADAFGQFEVALAVDVGVAAPEVGARQVRGRQLQALVPAVVVGPVVGDDLARQGAQGVDVRLRGLPGRFRGVHVAQQLDAACPFGDRDALAVGVHDTQPPHADTSSAATGATGAQPGAPPCIAVWKGSPGPISPAMTVVSVNAAL